MNRTAPFFILILLLATLAYSCARDSSYPEAAAKDSEIAVDTASLQPDVPKFFSYSGPDGKIDFFVIRIDGAVYSFLDACLSCTPRKGFSFSHGYFTCKVCGTKYSVGEVKHGIGGCYPIRVPGEQRRDKYYIKVSSLDR